jgi:hypothetical protein
MIEYLGIILDSDKMEARLPEEKVNRISKLLDPSTSGASIVKKSSNKCKIRAISYLFSAIQHVAFENSSTFF